VMVRFRVWLCYLLLELAMRVHPRGRRGLPPGAKVWQVIGVPRRISATEERQLAEMVKNL